jgi:hypothetical protein
MAFRTLYPAAFAGFHNDYLIATYRAFTIKYAGIKSRINLRRCRGSISAIFLPVSFQGRHGRYEHALMPAAICDKLVSIEIGIHHTLL